MRKLDMTTRLRDARASFSFPFSPPAVGIGEFESQKKPSAEAVGQEEKSRCQCAGAAKGPTQAPVQRDNRGSRNKKPRARRGYSVLLETIAQVWGGRNIEMRIRIYTDITNQSKEPRLGLDDSPEPGYYIHMH